MIEALPIGYARTTPDGEFLAANSTFVAMVEGAAREDVLSRGVEEFYRDEATREGLIAALREEGQVRNRELKVTTLTGETIWVLVTARMVETDDGRYVDALVQDITDRRRREDALREMHDIISAPDRSFEDQVEALLELGRRELDTRYGTLSKIRGDDYLFEIVATDDDSIQAGDVVPVSATNCELVASTEQSLVLGNVARDAPGETDRTGYQDWGISCYIGAPVMTDDVYGTFCFYDTDPRDGQFTEWESTLVDLMSRWVSYELQRRQVNARLAEKNEQLEQFASIVSHDLRNPLSVAQGRAELAAEACDTDHLDHVLRSLDRMEVLIDDLLGLALAGEQVGDTEPISPDSFGDWWGNVATRDATLRVSLDRSIQADPGRLQQLFENLVRNAVEHGGDAVAITVGELEGGFYVEDDGPGIPEDSRGDVLEAGFTTSEEGTGFGLSIVKQVVDAHGWDLQVTEGAAGGARFEVTDVAFTDG